MGQSGTGHKEKNSGENGQKRTQKITLHIEENVARMKLLQALQNVGHQLKSADDEEDQTQKADRQAGQSSLGGERQIEIITWHKDVNGLIQNIFMDMASEHFSASQALPTGEPVVYLFTRFPHWSETFLQREVRAMAALGVPLELHSLWGGADDFEGLPVKRFRKRKLAHLIYRLPWLMLTRPRVIGRWLELLILRQPISLLNLAENLLGFGFALVHAGHFRRRRIHHFHGVWATMPGAAAMGLSELTGHPYTLGAHAYDVFLHGGDPFLREKMAGALFVHTSVEATRRQLLTLTDEPDKIVLVRRGLNHFPPFAPQPLAVDQPLSLVSVGRLVAKKGLSFQLAIYAALRDAGIFFTAGIIGEGPLRQALQEEIFRLGLEDQVTLTGALSYAQTEEKLARAHGFLFTGIIDAEGNRDGVPNVVPEAMASGALVLTSPMDGVLEVIAHRETGFVQPVNQPSAWVETIRTLQSDPELAARVRQQARQWVETNFNAEKNAASLYREAIARKKAIRAKNLPVALAPSALSI